MMEKLFEKILKETNVVKGPLFTISSYSSEKPYKGDEAWRLKEKKALDEALGIGHDKKLSLRQLVSVINELPEKLKEYRNSGAGHKEDYRDAEFGCELARVSTSFNDVIVVKLETSLHYPDKISTGGYIEFFVQLDNDSVVNSLSTALGLDFD